MGYRSFWLVMIIVAVSASASCRRDTERASDNTRQEVHSGHSSPASAEPTREGPPSEQQAGSSQDQTHAPISFEMPPQPGTRAYCPVMGHDFIVSESSPRSEHNGRHFVFCCPDCKPRFDSDPAQFLNARSDQT